MTHSPTGYWANYRTLVHEPCEPTATHPSPRRIVRGWWHRLPVVGYTPDEEGQTWTVSLEVTTRPAPDGEGE